MKELKFPPPPPPPNPTTPHRFTERNGISIPAATASPPTMHGKRKHVETIVVDDDDVVESVMPVSSSTVLTPTTVQTLFVAPLPVATIGPSSNAGRTLPTLSLAAQRSGVMSTRSALAAVLPDVKQPIALPDSAGSRVPTVGLTQKRQKLARRRLSRSTLVPSLSERPGIWKLFYNVFPARQCHEWYTSLVRMVTDYVRVHGQPGVVIAGETRPERRQVAYFSKVTSTPYQYSGTTRPIGTWSPLLDVFLAKASELTGGETFDSVLCNWYQNGDNNIGRHRDEEALGAHVVSFSLYPSGTQMVRDFMIHDLKTDTLVTCFPLPNGSVLVMYPPMQDTYKHSVPERKRIRSGRINLTIRQHARLAQDGSAPPVPRAS